MAASCPCVVVNGIALLFLVDHGALQGAVEEVKSVGLVPLDGEAVAAKIELGLAREVILVLRLLRAAFELVVVDRLRLPYIVDPHDQRVDAGKRHLAAIHQAGENETDDAEHQDCDFQVGVHHQGITVLFEVVLGISVGTIQDRTSQ